MTKSQDIRALAKTGEARPVPMTKKQLLLSVAAYFTARAGQQFKAPLEIEHMSLAELRSAPTAGNIFNEVEKALGAAGVPTDGTMGSIMDPLGLTQDRMHDFCACHAEQVAGATAAHYFSNYAKVANEANWG